MTAPIVLVRPSLDASAREVPVHNVFCLGRTYAKHAAELGNAVPPEPLVFLKSTRALRSLSEGGLAFEGEEFHHEAEVVVLVGRVVARGQEASWEDVEAVGLGIDLTRRGVQSTLKAAGHPWTSSKSFEGSALCGPLLSRDALDAAGLDRLEFSLAVEGETRQRGSTASLTRPVPGLLTHLATLGPLGPGDLVYTGTPEGVGPIRRGEAFVLSAPWLGELTGRL